MKIKQKILTTFTVFLSLVLLSTTPSFAALSPSSKGLGCGGNFGPLADVMCNLSSGDTAKVGNQLNKVISAIIGFMTIVAALWFIFQLIIAAYGWINAGGDKHNVEMARDRIINSIIGLVIISAAWIIVGVLGKILGINILNPGEVLQNLGI